VVLGSAVSVQIAKSDFLSAYSTVSSVVERIKARRNKDRSLEKDLEMIGKKLVKSQQ
jgi:hypothetical protein